MSNETKIARLTARRDIVSGMAKMVDTEMRFWPTGSVIDLELEKAWEALCKARLEIAMELKKELDIEE